MRRAVRARLSLFSSAVVISRSSRPQFRLLLRGFIPPPQNVRKSKASYVPCAISGIIDDMSDPFPFTSSGSQWQGITDRVMGGSSNGSLSREIVDGRIANVLRGTVSLENGGGVVQMATDLSSDPSGAEGVFVDASGYDGVELDVYCEGMEDDEERFNVQ